MNNIMKGFLLEVRLGDNHKYIRILKTFLFALSIGNGEINQSISFTIGIFRLHFTLMFSLRNKTLNTFHGLS